MMKNIYHIFFCMSLLLLCSYGAKADSGNENFCFDADVPEAQMDLSVMCLTAPVLFCPPTYLGCPSDDIDPTNTGFPTAMPGDSSCPTPVVSFTDQLVSNTSCLKIVHRTWEASYPPGSASIKLHSTCQQTLFLEDNVAPTIINCPSDLTLDLSVSCDSTAIWTVPTAEDDCGIQFFITTHFSGATFTSGTTPVVYTASDQCGNENTCEFSVTVTGSCCTAPNITCPQAATVCPGGDFSPATTGTAAATMASSSCPAPTVTFTDATISTGPCTGAFVIQRTWNATVPTGSAACTQQITSTDTSNPIITNGPGAIQLSATGSSCTAIATWVEPTVNDNCNATVTSTHTSGTSFPEGMTVVTYTAVDDCGNVATFAFNVTVTCICSTPPVITCPANVDLCLGSNTTPSFTGLATAVAGDPSCGTPAINFTDVVSTPAGGCTGATIITRTWSATVTNNNSLLTSCVQTINVNDTSAPVITNVPQNINVLGNGSGCSATVTWSEPSATDNCGVATLVSTQSSGSLFAEGTTTVTYTAADACGNTTAVSFSVTVGCACNSVPQIICPANINACLGGNTDPSTTGVATATTTDPNCSTPAVTFTDVNATPVGNCTGAVAITRTWTATDPNNSGLTSSCVQTINLNDTVAPVISNVPQNITILGSGTSCSANVTWTEPVATDNCGVITLVSTQPSGSLFAQGTTTVTYTAADACGQTSTVSFTVTVDCACNAAPAITCPSNYNACPGSIDPSVAGSATAIATDTNCGTPTVSFSDQVISTGNCTGEQTIQRTWTATDAGSGLTSSCVQTLTLQDDGAAPTLTNIPTDLTVHGSGNNCNVLVKWTEPVATDGCGVASLTSSAQSGDNFSEGTTSVTYTATDACGNTTNASFNVTVLCAEGCNTPPIISCPNSFASCAGGSIPSPSVSGVASSAPGATGCGAPFVFYSDMITGFGSCNGAYTVERTWTAFDLTSAQISTCIQVIELGDNNAPVFSNVPGNLTLNGTGTNCTAAATWEAPTATDDCGINTVVSNFNSGDILPQGTTTITYTATDNCNNTTTVSFTVTVQCVAATCSVPPTISCPADYSACPGAGAIDPSITGQAIAMPGDANCSTPLLTFSDLLVNGSSTCTGAGTYNRTWIANDPNNANLSASCIQTITLQDNAIPVINNLPSNINLEVSGSNCEAVATWTAPAATDDCGIASLTSNFASGATFDQGTTTVTYTAIDNCGQVATGSFTVTVNCINTTCTTPPSISCPENYTACADGTVPSFLETGFAFGIINGDNCSGTPYTTFSDVVVNTGSCAGAQVIERTWITTDPDNKLQSSCVQIITLEDNSLPVISNIPNNIVVTGSGFGCQVPVSWAEPTATDDCGLASLSSNIGSGITFSSGTTTIVYTAVDNCGNIATASFTITVQCEGCNTPPTINCPASYTTCINGNIAPINAGTATGAISGPNCSGAPFISHVDNIVSTGPCAGGQVIQRLWMATDPTNNLAANCTQTITLEDNSLPVFSSVPGNIIVTGIGTGCQVPVTWNAPVASDNCGIDFVTSSNTNGSSFSEGTTTVTYTAFDLCGNSTTTSFTVTVNCEECTAPPSVTCPANYTACVGSNTSPSFAGVATGAPGANCTGMPSITFTDNQIMSGPCAGASVTERTWVAYDTNSNLTTSCVQTITLGDNVNPVIHNLPANLTLAGNGSGCQVIANWTIPTASDNCGTPTMTSNYPSGYAFAEGTTTVTYTATDACGNTAIGSFTVTVQCAGCNTAPTINCPTNYVACANTVSNPSVTGFAWASNTGANCSSAPNLNFTDLIVSTGPCFGSKEIERTWTATDPSSGLTNSCVQVISLGDNTPPTISNMPNNIIVTGTGSNCQVPVTWSAPTAFDNCSSVTLTSSYPVGSVFNQGQTTVTYTATDACGNQSSSTFIVTVQCIGCNTPPVVACPPNYTACPAASTSPTLTGYATAYNNGANCSATPTVTYSDQVIATGTCAGAQTISRTWTATDINSGLNSTCVQTISLIDNTPPVLTNVPADITVTGVGAGCNVPVTWLEPTATDNCTILSSGCQYVNGSVFSEGVYTAIYTATDNCGNSTNASFTITVLCAGCNTTPTITCPADYVACPTGSTQPSVTGLAVGNNTGAGCNANPTISHFDIVNSTGPCAGATEIDRVWTATDPSSGLNASCVQTITLEDTTPPTISNVPADLTISGTGPNCTAIATWLAPTTTDNCGSATYTCDFPSGTAFEQGATTVTCTATDDCGNQSTASFTVTVECEVCGAAPLITCPDNFVDCPEGTVPDTTVTGMPIVVAGETACATPVLTFADVVVSTGPCINEQVIERTFTATDPQDALLTVSCVQTIELVDTAAPEIANCPIGLILLGSDMTGTGGGTGSGTGSGTPGGGTGQGTICSAVATWVIPTVSDDCSTTTLVATDQNGNLVASGDIFDEGTTTVTYTATDNCGNTATCSFDIIVSCSDVCDIAPIAVCPDDVTVCIGSDITPATTGDATFIAFPLCIDIVVTHTDSLIATGTCTGEATIERSFLVDLQEGIGYQDSCTQIITIENVVPTLGACPADVTVIGDNTPVTWTAPSITDACGTATLTSTHNSGDTFPCGLTTVTYTLTDACGTAAECSFDIQVDCTAGNSGFNNCPSNITVACGETANWTPPTYTTACTTCTVGSPITGFIYMGNFNGSHYYCSTAPATWPVAKTVCEANGGFLADVNSFEENEFIADQLSISSAWIGLTDVNAEGQYEWCNGEPVSYTNWFPGQPNNFNNSQDYVEMLSTGEWNDQYNHYSLEYILEIPCTTITQTAGPAPGSVNPEGTYTVTYTVNDPCGSTETCSFDITVGACNTAPCASSGLISTFGYIDQCVFGDINNTSGNDGGYGNYSSICTEIEPGLFVPIEFHPGFGGGKSHTMYWTCWIDFNQDGDFEDNLEFVAYGAGAGTITGGITIPAGIPNGTCAMRVITKLGGYATSPCGTYLYGETEDYCINVVNGTLKPEDTDTKSALVINDPIELTALVTSDTEEVEPVVVNTGVLETTELETIETEITQDATPLEVRIYPNPVSQVMNLEINDVSEVTQISLYSQSGQKLRNIEIKERSRTDVSDLNGGMYIIRILRNDGRTDTEKVIIMN